MVYVVYLIRYYNPGKGRVEYYTGYTGNVERRMKQHKAGHTKSLRNKVLHGYAIIYRADNRGYAIQKEKRTKKLPHDKKITLYYINLIEEWSGGIET